MIKGSEIWLHLTDAYNEVATWVYHHPIRTDVAIVLLVTGSIAYILRRNRMGRRRVRRLLWGALMKRKDIEALQKMRFEDAILDAGMEMVQRGECTPAQEAEWYEFFSNTYGLNGLGRIAKTQESVKRGIQRRLNTNFGLKPAKMPGGVAKVEVDPTYKPVVVEIPERKGLETSKYV